MNLEILLDMDGVTTDFINHYKRLFGYEHVVIDRPNMEECLGISSNEFWNNIDKMGASFWASMPLMPDAMEIIGIVQKYDPNFCFSSSPSLCAGAGTGKILALQKHFGRGFTRYMIGKEKWRMSKSGVVLIDDFATNCDKFTGVKHYPGSAILLPRPWNDNRHIEPLSYLEDWLDILSARCREGR